MKRAFLIIDNQPGYASLLRSIIQREWDTVRVDSYNPDEQGWPEDVDWKHYSMVFIASSMGEDDGLEWLEVLRQRPEFPTCIILGNSGEADDMDIRARDVGAVDYLRKSMLSREHLLQSIRSIVKQHKDKQHVPADSTAVPKPSTKLAPDNTGSNDITPQSSASLEALLEQTEPRIAASPAVQTAKLRVDGYIIEKKIAEGGMSGIFLCTREEDGKPAVLKTISPRAEEAKKLKAVERSDLEFAVISRIRHPNVVRLYDHGRANGLVYTTMEYFSTGDLKQRMQQGITQQQALSYMVQVAEGLNAIHGSGIIHRDLKPANIMFREDETLAILDFGIAKDITRKMNLTQKGMRLGTPTYMSPEQGNGGYKLDARSDLYSLGVMLYEMLSKKRPYTGRAADVIRAHLNDPIPQLPEEFFEVQAIIDKLMGKFPHERIESAYDLTQFIKANYRYDTTLNFDFDPEGNFLSLEKDNNAQF